jgi:hypothetical protein
MMMELTFKCAATVTSEALGQLTNLISSRWLMLFRQAFQALRMTKPETTAAPSEADP